MTLFSQKPKKKNNHQEDFKKSPMIKDVIFAPQKRVLSFKEKIWKIELTSKDVKEFFKKHRNQLVLVFVIFIFVGGIFGYLLMSRADVANFYPSSCLGGWRNSEAAQNKPDVLGKGLEFFNEGNSAIYEGGGSAIFCGKFSGENINPDVKIKKAKIKFSLAVLPKTTSTTPKIEDDEILFIPDIPEIPEEETPTTTQEEATTTIQEEATTTPAEEQTQSFNFIKFLKLVLFKKTAAQNVEEGENLSPEEIIREESAEEKLPEAPLDITPLNVATDTATTSDSEDQAAVPESPKIEGFLKVSYTLDSSSWHILGWINEGNWQNLEFELPIADFEEIKNLQISIEGLLSPDETPLVYLDGMVLEVEHKGEPIIEFLSDEEIEKLPRIEIESSEIFDEGQKTFRADENPAFKIDIQKIEKLKAKQTEEPVIPQADSTGSASSLQADSQNQELENQIIPNPAPAEEPKETKETSGEPTSFLKKILKSAYAQGETPKLLKSEIFDPAGQLTDIKPFVKVEQGKIRIQVPEPVVFFKPGKYKMRVEILVGRQVFVSTQEFTWGVLAINTNKSIYTPDETAYLQMAVLDDGGHTVCDANLILKIKNQISNIETELSTADGTIQYSGDCGANNVTDKPDYFAYYQVGEPGKYEMTLTRIDPNTGAKIHEITDSFEVKNEVPFDVERIGPTRIYPPATYQMLMRIKANQDFAGEIIETVPSSFEIRETDAELRRETDAELIIWQVDWKAGENYELKYQFDAPDVSPKLYLLGPLNFQERFLGAETLNIVEKIKDKIGELFDEKPTPTENNLNSYILNSIFSETRQWQIAADADTGYKIFNGNAAVTSSAGDNDGFETTPGNATSSNDAYAVSTNSGNGNATDGCGTFPQLEDDQHDFYNFSFGIPSGSQINGIEIRSEGKVDSATGPNVFCIALSWNNGTNWTTATSSSALTTTDTSNTYGGATYTWGRTWSDTEFADGTFKIRVMPDAAAANLRDFSLDLVDAKVYYTYTPPLITVSGYAYNDADTGTTPWSSCTTTQNIALYFGGATSTASCLSSTGAFSFPNVVQQATSTPMVIWMAATNVGSNVNRYNGAGDVSNIVVRPNRVIVQHDDSGPITNANMDTWDNDNNTAINYYVTGSNLTVESGSKLIVGSDVSSDDTFTPGGTIGFGTANSNNDLLVRSGATLNGTNNVTVNGGDITGDGTISLTGGTSTLDGAGNFGGETAWIFYNLTIGGDANVETTTSTGAGSITVTNVLTIGANQILNAGSKIWTLSSLGTPFIKTGTFTPSTSTFKYTGADTIGPSTVATSSIDMPLPGLPPQRKTFYANGRFWVFYSNGTDGVYKTSTDGISWTSENVFRSGADNATQFAIFFDSTSTYFHYAYCKVVSGTSSPVYYRRGTPNSNGTISWSKAEQVAVPTEGTGTYKWVYPGIAVDSNGYPWIIYNQNGLISGSYDPNVTKSSTNDGTWVTQGSWFYEQHMSWYNSLVPLTNQRMYWFLGGGYYLRGFLWDGAAWGAGEIIDGTGVTYTAWMRHSGVNEGDDVHVVYQNASSSILYKKRTYGTGWGASTTVQATTDATVWPSLSIDKNNNLYCFWMGDPTTNHIYYKKRTGTTWDTDPKDWIDESSEVITSNQKLTSFYKDYGDHIGLLYMTKTSSTLPYNIKFAVLNPPNIGISTYITAATYNNLEFSPFGGSPTYNLATTTGQTLTTNGYLTIGDGTNAVTITANTYDPNLNIDGNFTISAISTFIASNSATTTFAGNWTNSGMFTHSTGTITFDDGSVTSTLSGATTFYNLTCNTSNKVLQFPAGTLSTTTIAGTLKFYGGGCPTKIKLRSTQDGSPWYINPQATTSINYVDLKDSYAITTTTIIADNSFNSENNTNWTINPGECGGAGFTTISGYAYADEATSVWSGCGTITNISLVVNGSFVASSTCTSTTGYYEFTGVSVSSTNPVSVFFNNTDKGVAVTVASSSLAITLNPRKNRVWLKTENGISNITNNNLNHCDSGSPVQCSNIVPYSVDGSNNLTVQSTAKLIIESNKSFVPGGSVILSPGATSTSPGGDVLISSGATFGAETNIISVGGDWLNQGNFSKSSGQTTTFTATTTGFTINNGGSNFENVIFNGSGGSWQFMTSTIIDADLTISAGTTTGTNDITVKGGGVTGDGTLNFTDGTFSLYGTGYFGGANPWTFYHLTFGNETAGTTTAISTVSATTTVSGNLIVTSNQILTGAKSFTVKLGNATGDGVINLTDGTFLLDGAGNFGGASAWTFNNLTFGDGSGITTTTATNTATTTVSNVLKIAANQTLNAGLRTWVLSGSGTPFAINGIFNSATSTFKYTGTANTYITDANYYNSALGPELKATAWLSEYTYRKKLKIDSDLIDANLTNFPVLVKLTSSTLDFSKANADGFDIRFTSDDGETLLKYERERHDQANKLAEYWVKVPSVSSSTDTDIYIYYRTTDTDDGASSTAVWDANFKGVWHLKDDPDTSTVQDSTISNYDGIKGIPPPSVAHPNEVNGKIAKGQNYDVDTETIQMGDVLDFEYNQPFTVEAWGKHTTDVRYDQIVSKGQLGPDYRGWYFWKWGDAGGNWLVFDLISTIVDAKYLRVRGSTALNDNVWRYLASTYNGSSNASGVKLYVNAVPETLVTVADNLGASTTVTAVNFAIGNRDSPASKVPPQGWFGILDEVRISNIVRPAAWLKATHNSINDTLLTYETEETNPGPLTYTLATTTNKTLTTNGYFKIGDGTYPVIVTANTYDPKLDIDGNFTISATSTFIASNSATTTFAGNWTNSGMFTHSTGTITFDGTSQQTLSGNMTGSSTFNILVFANTCAGCTDPQTNPRIIVSASSTAATSTIITASMSARFAANTTSTFTNINWNGQATTTRVALRSSVSDTPWRLVVTGSQTVLNVDAKDSNACGGNNISATSTTNWDSGGNTCWNFGAPTQSITLTISPTTLNLPSLTPGLAVSATSTATVEITGGTSGYSLSFKRDSSTSTLATSTLTFPDYTPAWISGTGCSSGQGNATTAPGANFSFRVQNAQTTSAYCTFWWGDNDNDGTAKYAGTPTGSGETIMNCTTCNTGSTITYVKYRADSPIDQRIKTYTGTITFTALANP